MNILQNAYVQICQEAEKAGHVYVSLYRVDRCYGGPEEGGWWYNHYSLESYQFCNSRQQAEKIKEKIEEKVKELNSQEIKDHGEQCLRELEYCESHGIDDSNSVFGEVNGPTEYYVVIEENLGGQNTTEIPHYE